MSIKIWGIGSYLPKQIPHQINVDSARTYLHMNDYTELGNCNFTIGLIAKVKKWRNEPNSLYKYETVQLTRNFSNWNQYE